MNNRDTTKVAAASGVVVVLAIVAVVAMMCYETIPKGHVGVTSLWGEIRPKVYEPGLHFAAPWVSWDELDTRQKTHMIEDIGVPSQDRLTTMFDLSIQYKVNGAMAPRILAETGTAEDLIAVHLLPKARSLLREQGKSIKRAEDLFNEGTQQQLQGTLQSSLAAFMDDKGITVTDVLLRDMQLPQVILEAITLTKQREQEAERQRAELTRFEIEQQQKVAEATAQRDAAQIESERIKLLADAKAYEIKAINEAIADSPAYIQLQSLQTLSEMSQNPATQIYFMDGTAPNPLPLLHMGDTPGQ